ncbi:MAG: hypothetical protein IT341_06955 [Chloroflexi bacterium]|nr:hypothetical protein [Chloroflexota bacterium]
MNLPTETWERIALLEEAADMVSEAIAKIEDALHGTGLARYADAYQLAQLKILAYPSHGYLTRDKGIHHLIEDLKQDEREQREEEVDEEYEPA